MSETLTMWLNHIHVLLFFNRILPSSQKQGFSELIITYYNNPYYIIKSCRDMYKHIRCSTALL